MRRDPPKHRPTGDYEVGYCRTPAKHRFRPGNNANPRGRKKGTRNRQVAIENILFNTVAVREGDEIKRMSMLEALLKKLISQALAGDKKAALLILGLAQREGLLKGADLPDAESLSADDQKLLDIYTARVLSGAAGARRSGQEGPELTKEDSMRSANSRRGGVERLKKTGTSDTRTTKRRRSENT
jgi:hypothetical protein